MSVVSDDLRKTMRLWVSGVSVVTTVYGDQRAGITVSSFTSVALEPPLILVCIQKHTEAFQLIHASGQFGVSLLASDQAHLSAQFAGFVPLPEGADRFHNVDFGYQVTGSPILSGLAAWMDCRLSIIHDADTTGIIVGEVLATGQTEDKMPLVYHNRGYFNLIPQAANT